MPMIDHIMWLHSEMEEMVKKDHPEFHTHWQIACIMRRAAGLPYSDTPASGWREDGTPEMFFLVSSIVSAASELKMDHPKTVSNDLYSLRHSLRDFLRKLLSIDSQSMGLLNQYADPIWVQRVEKAHVDLTAEEHIREHQEFHDKLNSPHHQTPIEVVLEQMGRFEMGLTLTLKDVEEDAHDREDMGQTRTYAAKWVALEVAKYMYEVTDKIPGYYIEENPRGYTKAVREIFDLLDIPRGSLQQAVKWAIAKLKSGLSFEVLQK